LRRAAVAIAVLLLSASAAEAATQITDIACETSTTAGTGTLDLAGAKDGGYLGFAAAGITSGNSVPYSIVSGTGLTRKLETGVGVFTDAGTDTLTRVAEWSTDGSGTELTLSETSTVCIGLTAGFLHLGAGSTIDADKLDGISSADFLTEAEAAAAYEPLGVTLGTDTTGNYVADVADGTGIDGTATGEGSTYTPTFDATELTGTTTFGAGAAVVVAADLQSTDDILVGDDVTLSAADGVVSIGTDVTFTRVDASDSLVIQADVDNDAASTVISLGVDGSGEALLSATEFYPGANDGSALGMSGNAWADLWLASGGLIEFDGGTTNTFTCTGGNCSIEGNGLYRAGGTDVAVADGGTGASSLNDLITLSTMTSGVYVAQVADGTGIDGTANAEGATYTPTLDLTELSTATFGAGAFTALTFDAGATDPTFTFGSNSTTITNSATFNIGTASTVTLGTLELGSNGTDTTIARSAAGTATVEGKPIVTVFGAQSLTSGTAATYTPTSGTKFWKVTCTGGGGAGGGSDGDTSSAAAGGGGEAGGTTIAWYDATEMGANAVYTIGTGGVGVAKTGDIDGNDTTFDPAGTGATMTAGGGDGGTAVDATTDANAGSGGISEGTAVGGDVNIPGGDGGYGISGPADGVSNPPFAMGGQGGASYWGGGSRPSLQVAAGQGSAQSADAYGAGGSGSANSDSATDSTGGSGKDGICLVEEFGS
jgi:hypothetical protein